MDLIKKMILTFVMVLAGSTICSALFITIFYPGMEFQVSVLWEIIIMSAISVLGNVVFYAKREYSKKQMLIRSVIHFLYVITVVLGASFLWKWVKPGYVLQIIVMTIFITAVYAVTFFVNTKIEERTAEALNNRLSEFNAEEEKEK